MSWTFDELLERIYEEERDVFGHDLEIMEAAERREFFSTFGLALHSEVTEMMDEVGWKNWTKEQGGFDSEKVASEAADLLHFLALILKLARVDGKMLTSALLRKIEINTARQAKGDDHHARRCPGCGRSLDDVGVRELKGDSGAVAWMCGACQTLLRKGEH